MAVPAPVTTRPLKVIDLLDSALTALRQSPKLMVLVVVGFVVPGALIQGWATKGALGGFGFLDAINDPVVAQEASQQQPSVLRTTVIPTLVNWYVVAAAGLPVSRIVSGWLIGRHETVGQVLRFTLRRLPVLTLAWLIGRIMIGLGTVLLLIPGFYVTILLALLTPVIAMEDIGPIAAIKRSRELVNHHFGPVLGLWASTGIVAYGINNAVSLFPTLGALAIGSDRAWPLVSVSAIVASLILVPFTTAAMCLMYLDIRFRAEGLDLAIRTRSAFPDRPTADFGQQDTGVQQQDLMGLHGS